MIATIDGGLRTPEHVHGVVSEAQYRQLQRTSIEENRKRRPKLRWRDPWLYVGAPPIVRVTGGKWVVNCACGNAPSLHPDWRLALCFECGAIYEAVTLPAEANAIVAALCLRAGQFQHWRPGETIADLLAENVAFGVSS